jgi:hypothetical protein
MVRDKKECRHAPTKLAVAVIVSHTGAQIVLGDLIRERNDPRALPPFFPECLKIILNTVLDRKNVYI